MTHAQQLPLVQGWKRGRSGLRRRRSYLAWADQCHRRLPFLSLFDLADDNSRQHPCKSSEPWKIYKVFLDSV